MTLFLTIVQVIVAVALIFVVLFQSGKSAGLSGAIAGGAETFMSKNSGLDQKLAKMTKWIALVFVLLTLALNLM